MLENEQKCLLRYKALLNCLSGKTKLSISEKLGVILIFTSSPFQPMHYFKRRVSTCISVHLTFITSWLCREALSNTGDPCLISSPALFVLASSCSSVLEKAMAPHSSTLAWKIPWAEEPGELQSMGWLRVGHDWATPLSLFTFMHWRRKWQPTPVVLPGESQGRESPVGCRLWGRTESDTTETT